MVRRAAGGALAKWLVAPREELCLDFVNTRYWRGNREPTETLHGIDAVLWWAGAKAGVAPQVVTMLGDYWLGQAGRAADALGAAIVLRETLHRMFCAAAMARTVAPADLDAFNAALAKAAPRERLAGREGRYFWDTALPGRSVAALLSPVLWSAADLLAGAGRERLRQCANERCRWLFLDHSKGAGRRWCSMAACGNRAKAQRHYLRRQQG